MSENEGKSAKGEASFARERCCVQTGPAFGRSRPCPGPVIAFVAGDFWCAAHVPVPTAVAKESP